jgi:solute carrier family 25 (mitochondrial oxoglutarate transporter), member 11
MTDNPVWKAAKPFFNGGLSGMAATCIIQPIDMVKVRIQLGATGGPVSGHLAAPRQHDGADASASCRETHSD